MALAIELVILPVAIILGIILLRIGETFSAGALIAGMLFFTVIVAVVYGLVRFAQGADIESGIDQAPDQLPPEEETPVLASEATGDSTVADSFDHDSIDHDDIVEECGDESFPASDPPSWTLGPSHPPAQPPSPESNRRES